jgi:hypothetical protein
VTVRNGRPRSDDGAWPGGRRHRHGSRRNESYEPEGPYGAKEIGEGTTLPVLGAVAHEIANATGVWVTERCDADEPRDAERECL